MLITTARKLKTQIAFQKEDIHNLQDQYADLQAKYARLMDYLGLHEITTKPITKLTNLDMADVKVDPLPEEPKQVTMLDLQDTLEQLSKTLATLKEDDQWGREGDNP